jgi:hypothetical protein
VSRLAALCRSAEAADYGSAEQQDAPSCSAAKRHSVAADIGLGDRGHCGQ